MCSYATTVSRGVLGLLALLCLALPTWAGVDCSADDVLSMPHNAVLNLTGDLSIAAWIKPRSWGTNSRGRILDKISSNTGYMMSVDNFAPPTRQQALAGGIQGVQPADSLTYATDSLALNRVDHVVFTRSAANAVALYVDGEPQSVSLATFTVALTTNTDPLELCASTGISRYFDGVIEEVYLYNKILDAQTIRTMALAQQRRRGAADPVVSLPLDDCATGAALNGVALADRSVNRSTLTGDDGANNAGMTCDSASIPLSGHGVW